MTQTGAAILGLLTASLLVLMVVGAISAWRCIQAHRRVRARLSDVPTRSRFSDVSRPR